MRTYQRPQDGLHQGPLTRFNTRPGVALPGRVLLFWGYTTMRGTKMTTSKAVTEMRKAAEYALANGWVRVPATPGIFRLRRSTTHTTPEGLPEHYWGEPTYDSHEFVSVVMNGLKISAVFHQAPSCPWVGGNDQKISAKRAREILCGT